MAGARPERFTANIVHHADPPLGKAQLDQLGRLFGEIPQLKEFYSRYGSVLYVDTIGVNSAFYIATPMNGTVCRVSFNHGWTLSTTMKKSCRMILDDYIVIGDMPATGNSISCRPVARTRARSSSSITTDSSSASKVRI